MKGALDYRWGLLIPVLLLGVVAQALVAMLDTVLIRAAFQTVSVLCVMTSTRAVATALSRDQEVPPNEERSPTAAERAIASQELRPAATTLRDSQVHRVPTIGELTHRRLPTVERGSGLLAQWYFILRIEEEIRRAKRYGHLFTVVTIETPTASDHRAAVDFVKRTSRETDLAGEMGERVALLMVQTGEVGADVAIERIRAALPAAELHSVGYPNEGVTASELLGEGRWWRSDSESNTARSAA